MPREAGKEKTLKRSLGWALIPLVFILDRSTKIWILAQYREGGGFPVIPGVFHVTRVNNTGAAFGLWRDSSWLLTAVTAVSAAVIFFYLFFKGRSMSFRTGNFCGWALVLGGALGNLYDRIRFGYVVDFLDFRVWPVFNLADSSICLGVFWIFMNALRRPSDASHPL